MRQVWLVLLIILLISQTTASTQAQNDDELQPGLYVTFTAHGLTKEQVNETLSFDWAGAPPDQRLKPGLFSARWSGLLLVQQDGLHRFHAHVQGQVSVEVGGKTVLQAQADRPQWLSGMEFRPELGLQPLRIQFEKTNPQARLHLYWSSEQFPLEPIPSHLLFQESASKELPLIDRGRQTFAAFRCGRCHVRENDMPAPAAPDWSEGIRQIDPAWLQWQIRGHAAGARMPSFGFTDEEAACVAEFLRSASSEPKLDKLPKPEKKRTDDLDRKDGYVLLRSVGCLACHALDGVGIDGPLSAPDLSGIGSKRSAEWFFTWLGEPQRLNPAHRMPVFRLTETERRQIALALASCRTPQHQPAEKHASVGKDSVQRGRAIVESARCAACHKIPGVDAARVAELPTLVKPTTNWDRSCLAGEPDRNRWRPSFAHADRSALQAYLQTVNNKLSSPSLAARGRLLLEQKNCLACHPRHLNRGLASITAQVVQAERSLAALAPALVPPNLTAVGDKLLDQSLLAAISGEQQIRKPWLKVRMPKFVHSDEEKKALLAYFVGHDRIPDGAPGGDLTVSAADGPVDDHTLLLGQTLVGPKGFSCIACHQMGSYSPRNAAIGTRGSDLLALRSRMRESFFHRWVNAPLRIVPGMEMPSYATRPVKGVLNDDIRRQLDTLWRTLNDSRFQPPTDPGSVEQYVVVDPHAPARIIRDVITNPASNGGGYVARSLAVGFQNQHNALYDLDTLTLRLWTFGDFARQRTVGKSWYWDMAGSPVVNGFGKDSDYALVPSGSRPHAAIPPLRQFGTVGKLLNYRPYQSGCEFQFELQFEIDGKLLTTQVDERLLPVTGESNEPSGWERRIVVRHVPSGFDVLIGRPRLSGAATLGRPTIERADALGAGWESSTNGEGSPTRELTRAIPKDGQAVATLRYVARLQSQTLAVQLKPPAQPAPMPIESTPGFAGVQLPLPTSIMPTAMTFLADGTLAFTSLKGHVYLARDTNGDGLEDSLAEFEEGLAAPYGIIADGDSLIVAHKPELLRLRDTDGDGRAVERSVFASGWGYNDNYHDWTCGIVRDSQGNLFVGLGSDYSQPGRPKEVSRWRGKVLKVAPDGSITPFAHAFRYPTGLAIDARGNLFASDNQGEQNCFNEINHLVADGHYGVESLHERQSPPPGRPPALQVPHPWTRSVNGLVILPESFPIAALAGHGLGAEYNSRFLVRFTYHDVDGVLQGAVFPFSQPDFKDVDKNFQGPVCVAVSPRGDIYVGSIHDSGWLGGLNVGSIVRLTPRADFPNGLRDIRATSDGFELEFFEPLDQPAASNLKNYSITGYTRVWQGTYETPDTGRYQPSIRAAALSEDGRTVRLSVEPLKAGFVYEIAVRHGDDGSRFWPVTGTYTLHRIPAK